MTQAVSTSSYGPRKAILGLTLLGCFISFVQKKTDVYSIIDAISYERIASDIRTLANFGTRHTLSDTLSNRRGIGAARRWIKKEFEKISSQCNNCLEVRDQKNYQLPEDGERIVKAVWINNVLAIQKGTEFPDRYIIMSGDIDARISDPTN